MRKIVAAGLLLLVGLIIAIAAGAFPCRGDQRDFLCGYRCESHVCIQDIFAAPDDVCMPIPGGCIGAYQHECCGIVPGGV